MWFGTVLLSQQGTHLESQIGLGLGLSWESERVTCPGNKNVPNHQISLSGLKTRKIGWVPLPLDLGFLGPPRNYVDSIKDNPKDLK